MHLSNGRDLYNHASTAVGYASSSEPLVRFGLGESATVEKIEVEWPGGGKQLLTNVKAGQVLKVTQP